MEYTIVSGESRGDIIQGVKDLLEKGWDLYGDLQMSAFSDLNSNAARVVYAQAMTKTPPKEMTS